MSKKVDILGIKVDNLTLSEALERVEDIISYGKPEYFSAINLNQIILYKENERFRDITDNAGLLTVDGQPVMWIAKLLHTPVKQKLTGPYFMQEVCRMAGEKGYKIFILGGADGSPEKAADNLKKMIPNLHVAGTYSPPFGFEKDGAELRKINRMLKESSADLLFVGLGSPKQDYFIDENKYFYQIPLSFSVGIAIDYFAGRVKRAPLWMNKAGLEWFYRFCQEPKRLFKRYFVDSWRIIRYYIDFVRQRQNMDKAKQDSSF